MSDSIYIGIDMGGTKIIAACLNQKLEIINSKKLPVPKESEASEIIETIKEAIDGATQGIGNKKSIKAIGIAVPGPIDRDKGILKFTPNMGFKDYPLRDKLKSIYAVPVFLDNDVQSGVLGELKAGALKGKKEAAGIFVGTGIGGGLVINGKLYRGAYGTAGEIGHTLVNYGGSLCGCGKYGCLETMASRTAVAKEAAMLASSGKAPELAKIAGTNIKKYKSSVLYEAIERGDKILLKVIERSAYWLGVGIANLVQMLGPEIVIIGGGLATRFGKVYIESAKKSLRENLMSGLENSVELELSQLGDNAVPTGAACFAMEALNE